MTNPMTTPMTMTLSLDTTTVPPPHDAATLHHAGEPLASARVAVVLLHGRGGSAADMLRLAPLLATPGLAFIAPQAAGQSWYPHSFLAASEDNERAVESAHALLEALVLALADRGLTPSRVGLAGFSQGACLATDHAAKFPRRYGFIAAYTGGLIGPPDTVFRFRGSLHSTPVFLGASDPDAHVPWSRVEATARELERLGGAVDLRRYPGLPHTVGKDHVDATRALISQLISPSPNDAPTKHP